MKHTLKTIVMVLIVSISAVNSIFAQDAVGTGLFKAKYQYSSDSDAEGYFQTAMIALFSHDDATAKLYFRDDLGLTCDDFRQIVANSIVDQSGYPIESDAVALDLFQNHLSFYTAYKEHWNNHSDTYLMMGKGQKLTKFNPLQSNRFQRNHWRIGRVTTPKGVADQSVYCANPTPANEGIANKEGFETFKQDQATAANAKAEASVVIRYEPAPQVPSFKQPVVAKKGGCTACYVGGGILLAGGIAYLALHKSEPKDNVYSNKQPGHQGESGPTTTQGGEGDQQTWSLAYSLMQKFTPSLALKTSVAAPKSLFTFTKVIHFR